LGGQKFGRRTVTVPMSAIRSVRKNMQAGEPELRKRWALEIRKEERKITKSKRKRGRE